MTAGSLERTRYVLLIEDNVHHAELVTELLDRHLAPVIVHTVDAIADAALFLERQGYDLVLSDASVRDEPLLAHIDRLLELAQGAPLIVIAGSGDERIAAELTRRGVSEYLVKTREALEALPALITRHVGHRRSPSPRAHRRRQHRTHEESVPLRLKEVLRHIDRLADQALHLKSPTPHELEAFLFEIERLKGLAANLLSPEVGS